MSTGGYIQGPSILLPTHQLPNGVLDSTDPQALVRIYTHLMIEENRIIYSFGNPNS